MRRLLAAAAIATLIVVGSVVYAFGKQSVFSRGYEVHAMFRDASQLRGGSPVRVGGLDVGRVTGVEAATDGTALVSLQLKSDAPRFRADDRLTIKPRLPFEGNFYIDIDTGNPSAAPLRAGDTVPMRLTTTSVQLDQVMSTFNARARNDAKEFIGQFAAGLGAGAAPTGGVPPTGAAGLRRANRELDDALLAITRTSRAFRGRQQGDLGRALNSASDLTRTVARNPEALADIVSNYARVIGRLAASDAQLGQTIRNADQLLANAPAELKRIDAVLPDVRRFAVDLRPALDALPKRLPALNRVLAQVASVSLPDRLPGLVDRLDEPVRNLPRLQDQLQAVLPYAGSIGRCVSKVVVPAISKRVPDGRHSVDQPAWLELLHAFSGFAAASPAFDANGSTIRAGLTEGDLSLQGIAPGTGDVINVLGGGDIQGVSPKFLGTNVRPKKRVDQPCEDQKIPDLTQLTQGKPFEGLRLKPLQPSAERRISTLDGLRTFRDDLAERLAPNAKKDGAR